MSLSDCVCDDAVALRAECASAASSSLAFAGAWSRRAPTTCAQNRGHDASPVFLFVVVFSDSPSQEGSGSDSKRPGRENKMKVAVQGGLPKVHHVQSQITRQHVPHSTANTAQKVTIGFVFM